MICFPNAKINIGLNILLKREDGYHEIESVMVPLKGILYDALEIIKAENKAEVEVKNSGLQIQSDEKNNLCVKAYELLKKDFPLPLVNIFLHKAIPMGAGLGGGSADGAFMLQLLNEEFKLNLSEKKLQHYAAQLGSECPFFISNVPAFVYGRGDASTSLSVTTQVHKKFLTIIYPNIHVSTAEAYSLVKPKMPKTSLKKLISLPVEKWKKNIHNDFEEAIFPKYPELQKIKEKLYSLGAFYASMSGSGSAVYGIFEKEIEAKKKFGKYKVWQGILSL